MEWKPIAEELPPFNRKVLFSDGKDIAIGYLDKIVEDLHGKSYTFYIEVYTRQELYYLKNGNNIMGKHELIPVKWMLIPE